MAEKHEEGKESTVGELHPSIYIVSGATMSAVIISMVWIGVYPETLLTFIRGLLGN